MNRIVKILSRQRFEPGTRQRWTGARTLRESQGAPVPEELGSFVNDWRMNLVEAAWLMEGQMGLFRSDFRLVADYFVQARKNKGYAPPAGTIRHVHELLQLMSVMTGDRRFEESYSKDMKGGATTMSDVDHRSCSVVTLFSCH